MPRRCKQPGCLSDAPAPSPPPPAPPRVPEGSRSWASKDSVILLFSQSRRQHYLRKHLPRHANKLAGSDLARPVLGFAVHEQVSCDEYVGRATALRSECCARARWCRRCVRFSLHIDARTICCEIRMCFPDAKSAVIVACTFFPLSALLSCCLRVAAVL